MARTQNQHVPRLMDQRGQLLKILCPLTKSTNNLFPRGEEKILILAFIRSGISLIINQKKTVECGWHPDLLLNL
uniref:Uncharacterized protein n=1 Tax=Arundo donax TaxID=35708 RepID=A0A0A9CRU9_ARUDO